eukprot:TRINITY_DN3357_c0_g1_i1.p1 TRINITY_DN3357_c0_g1~~TRINITY_DN3357_c0_g1_i1.p1  ORF type:complete len:303 (-),score=64.84 TRINITY_DN3357_c0_g1_i1:22-930(-)
MGNNCNSNIVYLSHQMRSSAPLGVNFVELSAKEVSFRYVPRRNVQTSLIVTNKTSKRVAFKIRTTAPKSYTVNPNHSVLGPHSSETINITMMPMELSVDSAPLNDKFQVQAIEVEDLTDHTKLNDLWRTVSESSSHVQVLKLPVKLVRGEYIPSIDEASPHEESSFIVSPADVNAARREQFSFHGDVSALQGKGDAPLQAPYVEASRSSPMKINPIPVQVDSKLKETYEQLLQKLETMRRNIAKIEEEKRKVDEKVAASRDQLRRNMVRSKAVDDVKTFTIWHVIIVAIACLIIGAFLSNTQ